MRVFGLERAIFGLVGKDLILEVENLVLSTVDLTTLSRLSSHSIGGIASQILLATRLTSSWVCVALHLSFLASIASLGRARRRGELLSDSIAVVCRYFGQRLDLLRWRAIVRVCWPFVRGRGLHWYAQHSEMGDQVQECAPRYFPLSETNGCPFS